MEPATGGLVIDPERPVRNLCFVSVNDPHLTFFSPLSSDSTLEVVEVAYLPAGPRAYFSGLTLAGRPVARVWRARCPNSTFKTFGALCDAILPGTSYAVSAYVYATAGSVQVSLSNIAPYSAVAMIGTGARLVSQVTATAGNAGWRLRVAGRPATSLTWIVPCGTQRQDRR